MVEVLFSVLIFLFIVGAMAVGVMMGREPIKGSCGGISALGLDTACDICGGDPTRCDAERPGPKDWG